MSFFNRQIGFLFVNWVMVVVCEWGGGMFFHLVHVGVHRDTSHLVSEDIQQ